MPAGGRLSAIDTRGDRRGLGGAGECGAEAGFVGDDALGGDFAVDGNDGRVPATAAEGVEEVVEPGLDADFDVGEVRGDALDEPDGEVALLADGVGNVDAELAAGHGVDGDDGHPIGGGRRGRDCVGGWGVLGSFAHVVEGRRVGVVWGVRGITGVGDTDRAGAGR